ncbi:hypothetical protein K450DRAFT_221621 [Umbelopsis ramanniana AG]|uniref:Cullin family profile domain-containing protein n=1 Tax=Umbelopsis ramanniana AG TaxID=1314678 RepID=A0AAD5HGI0_UMBRA|nr:uncharacterized protein K450DRAFT_221621 [Umbelopsis ramanniana AG]KAI8583532.1 hypothetical protein K450DRAFT_221621 [Umbelopsis ramanniana AG]
MVAGFPDDIAELHSLFLKLEQPIESIKPGGILMQTDYHGRYRQVFKKQLRALLPKGFEVTGLSYIQLVFEQIENVQPYLKKSDNFLINFSITSLPYRWTTLRRILSTTLEDELNQPFTDTFFPKAENLISICKRLSKLSEDNMEGISYSTPKNSADDEAEMPNELYAQSEEMLQRFRDTFAQVSEMDLDLNWMQVCKDSISKRLQRDDWAECWDENILTKGLSWVREFILPLVSCIENHAVDANVKDPAWLQYLRHKIILEHHFYHAFVQSRLDNIFGIIVDFPASLPAIEDLKIALEKTSREDHLRAQLLSEISSRLLHQGASTSDILHQFLSCIRCLQMLEVAPSTNRSVLAMFVRYLRSYRTDTAAEVIAIITNGDQLSAFRDSLGDEDVDEALDQIDDDDDEHSAFGRNSAEPAKVSWYLEDPNLAVDNDFIQKLSSNPVQLLIATCISKKAFLEDYKRFLATNLLVTRNYDTDNEVRLLELLKRSFGANKFHECDVMIKDIDDGKRVDKMIHDQNDDIATDFHGVILSKHYWPEMKDAESEAKLPEEFTPYMELYGDSYNSLKSNRKLKWLPALAKANVDVVIGDKTINVDLSPWGARILALFETKPMWTKQDICRSEGFDDKRVQSELAELVNLRILRRAKFGMYVSADYTDNGIDSSRTR